MREFNLDPNSVLQELQEAEERGREDQDCPFRQWIEDQEGPMERFAAQLDQRIIEDVESFRGSR